MSLGSSQSKSSNEAARLWQKEIQIRFVRMTF